ncbi:C-type lectin mosGCTL-7-like [Cochliomyia hominivorax]
MVDNTKTLLLPFGAILFVCIFSVNGLTTDIGRNRYVIEKDKTVNWFQANHACTLLGMSLASIETEEEFKSIKKYLNDQDITLQNYWLSGSNLADSANAAYTWLSSGNKLDFTKWQTGNPLTTAGLCIYTDGEFKWNTIDCAKTTKNYICSRPLVPDCGITGRCQIARGFFF